MTEPSMPDDSALLTESPPERFRDALDAAETACEPAAPKRRWKGGPLVLLVIALALVAAAALWAWRHYATPQADACRRCRDRAGERDRPAAAREAGGAGPTHRTPTGPRPSPPAPVTAGNVDVFLTGLGTAVPRK
jgi:hypothetical protein